MINRKVNVEWAFSPDGQELSAENNEIYNELRPYTKIIGYNESPTPEELNKFVCYEYAGTGYANQQYHILSNPHNFTSDELALICDRGNLCFGYRRMGNTITVYTD